MKFSNTSLPEVLLIEPTILSDSRGFFYEHWNRAKYEKFGLSAEFVQDNISVSRGGVLRGLHFQHPHAQGKLISVLEGEIFDVAVDVRPNSPHFKQWFGCILNSTNRHQLWIPTGFAHGFCVLSQSAMVSYKTSDFYSPKDEFTLLWNDPEINIDWPLKTPELSEKDRCGILISQIPPDKLPEI